MIRVQGKGVYKACAIGHLYFLDETEDEIERKEVSDREKEVSRFFSAREMAIFELSELFKKAKKEFGEENALIFDIHKMMIEDLDFTEQVKELIEKDGVNAEFAVKEVTKKLAETFSSMDDDYMKERATDVLDASTRLLKCLRGEKNKEDVIPKGVIICGEDLSPSETIKLDKTRVLAFLTQKGSVNSHTAILARTMNIPAVIGLGEALDKGLSGKLAAVDGHTGEVFIEPDSATLLKIEEKIKSDNEKKARFHALLGKDNITKDGKKIEVYANIGGLSDLDEVIRNDAGGIGLFRSEFLYLESRDFPTEELQFKTYKKVLERMGTKKVVIRTLDIGADKKIGYFNLADEENPALGYRAIRICLSQKDIFKTQLRALFRASVYGNLSIMFPMIISKDEILEVKKIMEEVKGELKSEGISYSDKIEIGIMIETPASAIISDILAPEVDFFSVGTNDLTQYTLAIDRQNPKLDQFYDAHHESVLRLVEIASKSAHKYGKWIGICGELGADTSMTDRFLKMGIDEFSVSPPFVLELREKIRESSIK